MVLGEINRGLSLGDQRNDGDTRVSSDDRNIDLGGVKSFSLTNEGVGTDNVQGGNTKYSVGVVDSCLLIDLRGNGHSAVDLQ